MQEYVLEIATGLKRLKIILGWGLTGKPNGMTLGEYLQ